MKKLILLLCAFSLTSFANDCTLSKKEMAKKIETAFFAEFTYIPDGINYAFSIDADTLVEFEDGDDYGYVTTITNVRGMYEETMGGNDIDASYACNTGKVKFLVY
jgi:hypothetical protein